MSGTSVLVDSEIVRGRVEMRVPHLSSRTTFVYPAVGPGTYQSVGRQIKYINDGRKERESGLVVPVGDVSASLLDAAYFPSPKSEGPEFANVRDIMKQRWLWVFQKNLWTPQGVYVQRDPEAKGLSEQMNLSELEKAVADGREVSKGVVFSRDGNVRFASLESYQLPTEWTKLDGEQGVIAYHEQTPEALARDGFVIAGYGVEGAKKLERVARTFSYKPVTWGSKINEGKANRQTLSALGGDGFVGGRLGVVGNYFDYGDYCFAFGVSPSTEGA